MTLNLRKNLIQLSSCMTLIIAFPAFPCDQPDSLVGTATAWLPAIFKTSPDDRCTANKLAAEQTKRADDEYNLLRSSDQRFRNSVPAPTETSVLSDHTSSNGIQKMFSSIGSDIKSDEVDNFETARGFKTRRQ